MAKTPTDANAISESGEGRALAEAGRNQVSDRRDVVGPDDRHQPLQERQAEQQHQRRTQVDRNAGPAVAHGGAHGTEERPRRAIDAEGQAVDPRPQARVTRVLAGKSSTTDCPDCSRSTASGPMTDLSLSANLR